MRNVLLYIHLFFIGGFLAVDIYLIYLMLR